jgi:H+/Cl- antiporter ClcA
MSSQRQPAPPPLEGPDQLIAGVITAAWAVALIVLLAVRSQLPGQDRWWIWVCAAGIGAGLFGLWYMPVLKRSRARAAERRAVLAARSGPP